MRWIVLICLATMVVIGCSKKKPTEPTGTTAHGSMALESAVTRFSIATFPPALEILSVNVVLHLKIYEPSYVKNDSSSCSLYLNNGKLFTFTQQAGYVYPENISEYYWYDNSTDTNSNDIELSDSLAIPDSIIFNTTYTSSTGALRMIYRITPADTMVYHHYFLH